MSIFALLNERSPSREPLKGTIDYIDPYRGVRYDADLRVGVALAPDFRNRLAQALESSGREGARTEADGYIVENGIISRLAQLGTPLAAFDQAVVALSPDVGVDTLSEAVRRVFDGEPKDVIARDDFQKDRRDLADSITAAFFASSLPVPRLSHLIRGLRLCELIERLANADPDIVAEGGVARALRAIVVILSEDGIVQLETDNSLIVPQPLYRLSGGPAGDRFYTTSSIERDSVKRFGYSYDGIACYVYSQPVSGTIPLYRLKSTNDHFYTTSSIERYNALQSGYSYDGIACYVYSRLVSGSTPLYRLVSPGHHFYTTSSIERDNAIEMNSYVFEGIQCYVISVPITAGAVKPAGVSDLLVVRQTLRRYDRGEIAHVENALKGEFKERTHRRTQTTETLLFQETETTTENERDLQTTERFELKREADKTVREDMQAQAGFTVTGSYGTVTATATGQFAFERSVEEATRTASTYARDVVERARSRVQERTLERRSTRTVLETEETAKHGLDNTKEGADHIVGVYVWLDKVYEAQIVNYGKRLMLEFYVPEPAAYHRAIEAGHRIKGLTREKPEKPTIMKGGAVEDLRPELVEWPEIQKLAAKYGASGIEPPPPLVVVVGTKIEVPFSDKDYDKEILITDDNRLLPALGGTKVSDEIKITKGYIAKTAKWSGERLSYVRKYTPGVLQAPRPGFLEEYTSVSVGSVTGAGNTTGEANVDGFTDALPVGVITSAAGLVVTFRVECHRTNELVQDWQAKACDAIMAAYRDQLQQYEEEVARLNVERGVEISGRPSAENRKIEQTELKRATISILTGQHFDAFGAIDDAQPQDTSKSPKIEFSKAAAERDIVQYFEQSFEWHNMTYLFYPFFWGRKGQWPEVLGQESTDPLFKQFLKAGYARVQVPVRLNYETMVLYFLTSSKLWQEAEDAPVAERYLPIVDEIRNQTGDDFTIGKGSLNVKKDDANATGNGTSFSSEDIDREIRIQSKVYRISSVQSATQTITLAKPFTGNDDANAAYSLGPKLVGPSWEVRLPTTLVMIDKPDIVLPSWPDD